MDDAPHALPPQISGVVPSLSVQADLGPPRSEGGVGALLAWAGRLWMVSYVAHKSHTGSGTGLYEIDRSLGRRKRPESVVGTYTNRLVHHESNQLIIGPHVIDAQAKVRTVEALIDYRLTGTCRHLHEPDRLVYMLGMEGELFELDVHTLACAPIADLARELALPDDAQPHFKGAFGSPDHLYVTNNTYDEREHLGQRCAGRLAQWDGQAWTIVERRSFYEVAGRQRLGGVVYAAGWDAASAILKVRLSRGGYHGHDTGDAHAQPRWLTYRLPKASPNYEHTWQHEWPRIREIEHERVLGDIHGLFYELSPHAFGGHIMPVRPIACHLWAVTDFTNWQGMLIMGSNQMTPFNGDNVLVGEPDSGIWVGKTDDLWQFGPPRGWGGPWRNTPVKADEPSDPYLMTGFGHKSLHVRHDHPGENRFSIELDFTGDGDWATYAQLTAPGADAGGYASHTFPPGLGAHWIRLRTGRACRATAQLHYT